MIFGFAINSPTGSSSFGVVSADSTEAAQQRVSAEAQVDTEAVVIMSAEEALSQFDGVASLSPAEA
jgi:hypothetical protein